MAKKNRSLSAFVRLHIGAIAKAIKSAQVSLPDSSGSSKLDWAVEQVNELVDIPLLPEWVEELVFKTAITVVVELAKSIWGDEDWFTQLMRALDLDD